MGGTGDDTINDGDGADIIIGGDGADTINLIPDDETDVMIYGAISEAGDTVNGFDVDAPGNGDIIDLTDLLDSEGFFTGTNLAGAEADGFVILSDDGSGNALVEVDLDGSAGGTFSPTLVATLNTVDFNDLADNIIVD